MAPEPVPGVRAAVSVDVTADAMGSLSVCLSVWQKLSEMSSVWRVQFQMTAQDSSVTQQS